MLKNGWIIRRSMVWGICYLMVPQEFISMIQQRSLLIRMVRISNIFKKNKVTKPIPLHLTNWAIIHLKGNFKKKSPYYSISEIISMLIPKFSSIKMPLQIQDIAMSKNGWKLNMQSCLDSAIKLFKSISLIRLRSFYQASKSLWHT